MQAITTPRLEGSRILLRELRESDAPARRDLGQHPEIERMWGTTVTTARRLTDAEAHAWYQANLDRANPYYWIIEYRQLMVGAAYLHSLNWTELRARFAISLFDPAALGRGLGTESTELVLDYAFTVLRLHRVDLRVLAFNERAIACYRKCGFVVEGRERETALINDVWHDDLIMSILDHEYHTRHESPRDGSAPPEHTVQTVGPTSREATPR